MGAPESADERGCGACQTWNGPVNHDFRCVHTGESGTYRMCYGWFPRGVRTLLKCEKRGIWGAAWGEYLAVTKSVSRKVRPFLDTTQDHARDRGHHKAVEKEAQKTNAFQAKPRGPRQLGRVKRCHCWCPTGCAYGRQGCCCSGRSCCLGSRERRERRESSRRRGAH